MKKIKYYLGLDCSLNKSGFCLIPVDIKCSITTYIIEPKNEIKKPASEPIRRLQFWRKELDIIFSNHYTEIVACAVEGYSMGSNRSRREAIGELGGLVRIALRDWAIPAIAVPPCNLKIYACGKGKGHAKKEEMVEQAKANGVAVKHDDEADAYFLARMAKDFSLAGGSPEKMRWVSSIQREQFSKVEILDSEPWPMRLPIPSLRRRRVF